VRADHITAKQAAKKTAYSEAARYPLNACFCLTLAERENAPLVSADEVMITAARKAKIKVRRI